MDTVFNFDKPKVEHTRTNNQLEIIKNTKITDNKKYISSIDSI